MIPKAKAKAKAKATLDDDRWNEMGDRAVFIACVLITLALVASAFFN